MGITFRGKTTNDTPTVPRLGLAWLIRRRDPRSQRNPNPAGFGYGTAWGVGIVLSVLSLPIALCLTAWHLVRDHLDDNGSHDPRCIPGASLRSLKVGCKAPVVPCTVLGFSPCPVGAFRSNRTLEQSTARLRIAPGSILRFGRMPSVNACSGSDITLVI
jgi:hypothetical protein